MAQSNEVKLATRITRIVKSAATMSQEAIKADGELRAICAACVAANSVEPLQMLWDKLTASDSVSDGTARSIATHVKHRLLVNANQNKDGDWQVRTGKVLDFAAGHADAPRLGERSQRAEPSPTKSPVTSGDLARLVKRATVPTTTQAAGGFYWQDAQGNMKRHAQEREELIAQRLVELAKLMESPE